MRFTIRGALLLAALLAVACGDDGSAGDEDMGPIETDLGADVDLGPPPVDAFIPGGERLVLAVGDWEMPAGQEGYRCVRQTLDETIFVHEFLPIAPEGTHHTVVTFTTTPSYPDGVTRCDAATNDPDMIYGSGVGTEPLTLPDGVAVEIPAGAQVLVNLHLYNTGSETLTGSSGIEVVTMPEALVENRAEVILAGPVSFNIPPMTSGHVINGGCTMADDVTVFAVMPHMHQLGTAMTVEVGGDIIYEGAYTFDDQKYHDISPLLPLSGGTRVGVSCTYDNPTSSSVGFGDSTNQEMCFALLYRFPALGDGIFCPF